MPKRIGRIVKVHNQASKQAKAPKVIDRSRTNGKTRKFFNRSNLIALDSYGISLVYEWWMYKGLGRDPANSSCKSVGTDMGGRGIVCGIGDGGAGSGSGWRGGGAALGSAPESLKLLVPSRSRGGGRGFGWYELRRFEASCAGRTG